MKNIDYRWVLAGTALVLLIILFWKPLPLTDAEPEVFYIETDEEPGRTCHFCRRDCGACGRCCRPSRRVTNWNWENGWTMPYNWPE